MKERFSLSIYARAADYVVVPLSGGGGPLFAVEPVERVALDVGALATAIERAVAVSELSLGHVDLRAYRSPVPKALGLRSNKQFESSVIASCAVDRRGGEIEIALYRRARDGRGFEPTARSVQLAPDAAAEAVARCAMELMNEANAGA